MPQLDLIINNKGWANIRGLKKRLTLAAEAVAAHLPAKYRYGFSATVLLTGDKEVQELNHNFRAKDTPTNVLSFPQYNPEDLPIKGKVRDVPEMGDIALAYAYTAKEAKKDNKLMIDHTTHLVIHGLLHLFGYDHMIDREAEVMERLEIKVMKALGLPNPYDAPLPQVSRTERRKK